MFKAPFSFKGRIRRLEYGITLIAYFGVSSVLGSLSSVIKRYTEGDLDMLVLLLYIPLIWIVLAQGTKRSHDTNRSGLWQLFGPYIVWLIFAEGDAYINDYGVNPKTDSPDSSDDNLINSIGRSEN